MAALDIPGVGEPFGVTIIREFTVGASGESPDVTLSSAAAQVAIVNINEPNVFVEDIMASCQITIATNNTGVIGLAIGDGTDTDGWWTAATLPTSSAAAPVYANMATSMGFYGGKLYATTDTIDIGKTIAVASVGKLELRITYQRSADTNLNPATAS
jgi:hypothetical protein